MVIVVYLLILVLGAFLFYSGLKQARNCTTETNATIVDIETTRSRDKNDRRRNRYPVVEFMADNGQQVHKRADVSSQNRNKYQVGERLTVKYNPQNPEEFIVKGKSLAFNLGVGALMVVFGLIGLITRFM
ncbi:MAG: DUF3592 domain-containing protein [Lachnospiraceae bacterium]|nr:DUF3592 domain-containing protein [Lachnospiraceae bacterium]